MISLTRYVFSPVEEKNTLAGNLHKMSLISFWRFSSDIFFNSRCFRIVCFFITSFHITRARREKNNFRVQEKGGRSPCSAPTPRRVLEDPRKRFNTTSIAVKFFRVFLWTFSTIRRSGSNRLAVAIKANGCFPRWINLSPPSYDLVKPFPMVTPKVK